MPAPAGRVKKPDAIWSALRTHIVRERQKKKQEQEADAEVERQRKERERQQKQDKMTLGETREQLQQLETRMSTLKEEKHQLFLKLKKVLNEDDRRRQLIKESSDLMGMQGYSGGGGSVAFSAHPQLFLQPNMNLSARTTLYKLPLGGHVQHTLIPSGFRKRSRSPSPPPPQTYHHAYNYKPAAAAAAASTIPHFTQQKLDDGRRGHEYARAVLWNKNPASPYGPAAGSSGAYYSHPPVSQVTSTTVSYAPTTSVAYTYSSGHPQYSQPPPGAAASRDEPSNKHAAAAGIYLQQAAPRSIPPQHGQVTYVGMHPQLEHLSQKPSFSAQEAEKFYSVSSGNHPGVAIRPATHVPIHGGSIPIQQAPQGAKSGGITSGYPIRVQPSPHVTQGSYQQSSVSAPHNFAQCVSVSQAPSARLVYTQPMQPQHSQNQHLQQSIPQAIAHAPPVGHGPVPGRYNVPGLQREV